MQIQVNTVNIDIEAHEVLTIEAYAEKLFSRTSQWIERIEVTLSDENGPKGGVDRACTVIIRLKKSSPIVLKDISETNQAAVVNALQRARYALTQQQARQKTLVRRMRRANHGRDNFSTNATSAEAQG